LAPIIEARGLVKEFNGFRAVDGIDFEINEGEFFGMLGPNGAGKTSTIRMIGCVVPVTEGSLTVGGFDVRRHDREVKSLLGVVPQDDNLDEDLSVRRNLEVYARYYDIPREIAARRIEDGLVLMHLLDRSGARINELSGGMKRRLVVARALLNDPRVLILDEPTTGLDPQARHLVWRRLRVLRERGVTILLTTHYMDEAEHLCERIVIMDGGRTLAEGRPRDLIQQHVGANVLEMHLLPDQVGEASDYLVPALGESGRLEQVEDVLYAFGADQSHTARIEEIAGDPYRVLYRRANLEDVFLTLTGRVLAE